MKYEKSNDKIPVVEMKLAKLVQNAKANNLDWTAKVLWRDKDGGAIPSPKGAASCCALGAARLAKDTKNYTISTYANDCGIISHNFYELPEPELLGLGFRLAMKD